MGKKTYHCVIRDGQRPAANEWLDRAMAAIRTDILPELGTDVPVRFGLTFPMIMMGNIAASTTADPPAKIVVNPAFVGSVVELLGTLVHEGIHASLTNAGRDHETAPDGHSGPFATRAYEVGLAGDLQATTVGPLLSAKLRAIVARIGTPPAHADAWRIGNGGPVHTIKDEDTQCPIG